MIDLKICIIFIIESTWSKLVDKRWSSSVVRVQFRLVLFELKDYTHLRKNVYVYREQKLWRSNEAQRVGTVSVVSCFNASLNVV